VARRAEINRYSDYRAFLIEYKEGSFDKIKGSSDENFSVAVRATVLCQKNLIFYQKSPTFHPSKELMYIPADLTK